MIAKRLKHVFIIFIAMTLWTQASAKSKSLAIFPFKNQSGEEHAWLSLGICDTFVTKFSDVRELVVVERAQVERVLKEQKKGPIETRRLLGADYLLVGAYHVASGEILMNMRIVDAQTSRIELSSLIKVRGPLRDIFALQTQMAHQAAVRCGLEISMQKLSRSHGRHLDNYQLLGLGKLAFEKGEYEKAIKLLIDAQIKNQGHFLPEAHHFEHKARVALAKSRKDAKAKARDHAEHIAKFRKDAASASPAFHDLALAYMDQGNYREAIDSIDHFITWYDKNLSSYIWTSKIYDGRVQCTKTDHFYLHSKAQAGGTGHNSNNGKATPFKLSGELLYFVDRKGHLFCVDANTGKQRWKEGFELSDWKSMVIAAKRVYICDKAKIYIFDKFTGKAVNSFKLSPGDFRDQKQITPKLLVLEDKGVAIHLLTHGNERRDPHDKKRVLVNAYDLSNGKTLWSKSYERESDHGHTTSVFAATVVRDRLCVLINGDLLLIDPLVGSVLRHAGGQNPYQGFWPGGDHLLLRRNAHPWQGDDHYQRYDMDKNRFADCSEQIFYSPNVRSLHAGREKAFVPIMDRANNRYRLVPGRLLFKHTVDPKMCCNRSLTMSWVLCHGKELLIWTKDLYLRVYNLETGMLDKKFHMLYSQSGFDYLDGRLAMQVYYPLNAGVSLYRLKGKLADSRRVEAIINKGDCLFKLGDHGKALKQYKNALNYDSQNVAARLKMSRLYLLMNKRDSAGYEFDALLQFAFKGSPAYREAFDWLSKEAGLIDKRFLPEVRRMTLTDEALFLEKYSSENNRLQLEAYSLPKNRLTVPPLDMGEMWKVEGSYLSRYLVDKKGISLRDMISGKEKFLATESREWSVSGNHLAYRVDPYVVGVADMKTMKLRWKHEMKYWPFIHFHKKRLYVIEKSEHRDPKKDWVYRVYCFEPQSGKVIWRNVVEQGFKSICSSTRRGGVSAVTTDKHLYFATYGQGAPRNLIWKNRFTRIHRVRLSDGEPGGHVEIEGKANRLKEHNGRGSLTFYNGMQYSVIIDDETFEKALLRERIHLHGAQVRLWQIKQPQSFKKQFKKHPEMIALIDKHLAAKGRQRQKLANFFNELIMTEKYRQVLISELASRMKKYPFDNSYLDPYYNKTVSLMGKKDLDEYGKQRLAVGIIVYWGWLWNAYQPLMPRVADGSFLNPKFTGGEPWIIGRRNNLFPSTIIDNFRTSSGVASQIFYNGNYAKWHQQQGDHFAFYNRGWLYLFDAKKFVDYLVRH